MDQLARAGFGDIFKGHPKAIFHVGAAGGLDATEDTVKKAACFGGQELHRSDKAACIGERHHPKAIIFVELLEQDADGFDHQFKRAPHHGARKIDTKHQRDRSAVSDADIFGGKREQQHLLELLLDAERGISEMALEG